MSDALYRRRRAGLPAQILDLLDIDPGWWTTSAVMERFSEHKPETVRRALIRLRQAGLLDARPRLLNEHITGNVWAGQPEHEHKVKL